MICMFLHGRMKKAIWLLAFSLLVMPLLIQFFEVDCFRTSASEDAVPIEFGETLSGSIDVAGETDAYVFSANASDVVLVRVVGLLYPEIRLYSPNGTKLKGASGFGGAELSSPLPDDGEYKILVYDTGVLGPATGSYTIYLQRLNNPVGAVSIEFGDTISGSIDAPAEMDTYVLWANASDVVLVRVSGITFPGISLYCPNGTKLKGASGLTAAELSSPLPDDGEYKILVYVWQGTGTGSYTLSLKSITIWSSDSIGNEKNTFASTETVYATVPATGENVTFYIVAGQDVWNDGDPLTDVSDGAEQLTLDPGPGIQVVQVWEPPLTLGSYDIVEDTNNNGLYDAGVDGIDSVAEVGFVVEYPPENNPPDQPQLSIAPSLAVEDDDDLIVTVIGPTPADPDGDTVTYTYRWLVDVGTEEFLDDELAGRGDHTGNMVPAADTVIGDVWRVEVTPVDEHEAVGLSAIATWQVVVDATKPVADAGPDQTVNEDTLVAFNGSNSYDNIGVVNYTWTFTDVTPRTLTGVKPTYNFTNPNFYSVTLNVTDAAGNWDTDTVVITVNDITHPAAEAGLNQTVVEDTIMSFDAGGSSDNVGIVSYEWDFGDGTTGTGLTVNHTYAEPGTYNVTLTVTDATGYEDTHSITITVLPTEPIREPRSVHVVAEVAVVAAAVTATTAALASFAGLGQSFNSAISKLPIPDELKEFLKLYGEKIFETVDKVKLEALEKAPFITKGELAALGISALVTTIVFSFVEANGLPHFLDPAVLAAVIPSTLLSACMMSIVGELSKALCARTCRVYRQYRLWMYGLGAFLISGLLFLFPFASPGITRYQSGEISDKTKGLIVLSKMLILLTLTIPFAGLIMLGFKIVGDAGLLLTLMTVCYSLVPLKPLAGKAVFDYRKEVSLIALVSAGILFYSCTFNLLPHVTYLVVGVASVFLAAITLIQLRKAHPK